MKRLSVLTSVLAVLSLALPAGVASGQPAPPGPTTVIEKRFEAVTPPAEAEVLQAVLDFAPGAWTPVHTHGGPVYVTVLEGEATLRMGGADQKFRAGEGWIDSPDEPHAAGNDAAGARVLATFVLPRGATPTIVAETGAQGDLPPGPTTVVQFRTDAPGLPGPMDAVQRLIEYPPASSGATHVHPGPNHITVLEGEFTVREGSAERKVGALQSFVEPAGQVHSGHNTGGARTRLVTTALVPRGAPYSTTVEQPAPAAAPAPPLAAPPAAPAPAPVQLPRSR
jgi:quercetin dioxygenase-like cupin family protein